MRGRTPADRPRTGRHRLRPSPRTVHALSPHHGTGPRRRLPRTAARPPARPLAHPLRRTRQGARLLTPPRGDRPPQPALGHRAVLAGGPAPRCAPRLDRPARRRLRGRSSTTRRIGAGRARTTAVPTGRTGHRPRLRQPTARARRRGVRPSAPTPPRRPGRRRTGLLDGSTDPGRAPDPSATPQPDGTDLAVGVARRRPGARTAARSPGGGPLDA